MIKFMQMKTKVKFLLMLLVALPLLSTLNSCKNDDDDSSSLVGTWYYRDVTTGEIKTNSSANDLIIKSYVAKLGVDDYIGFWFEFKADGTCRASYKDEKPSSGSYTYANGVLTVTDGGERTTMNVSVVDDVLTFEKDYTAECNRLSQSLLSVMGVKDPANFKVIKAIGKINFLKR